jgi:hypothetical protein
MEPKRTNNRKGANFTIFLPRANGFEKTHDAARDFDELYDYITLHDAPRKPDCGWEQIEKAFSTLSKFPGGELSLRNCFYSSTLTVFSG